MTDDNHQQLRLLTWVVVDVQMLELLRKEGCITPLPIQAQALPCIMSGRDCIGIAKTGSGKTLAFVLPMLRHVKDQPPLAQGDGPIALVMAPTRELVQQISKASAHHTCAKPAMLASNQVLKLFLRLVCLSPLDLCSVDMASHTGFSALMLQEIKKFARSMGIECTAVFGGSGVANQISELKRGVEVVVCTPGRMIDLLVTSNGG